MMSKSHITVNLAVMSAICISADAYIDFVGANMPTVLSDVTISTLDYFSIISFDNFGLLGIIIGFMLYVLGSILPDIDSDKSLVGRYFPFINNHRGIFHSIWVLIPLFIIGHFWLYEIRFLFLGYLLHLVCDSVSVGGICWFYPISKYITYGSGAKVKRGHVIKLYRAGKKSETVVVFIIVALMMFINFKILFL